ncbi:winged helix-turn-helix transcriptional regulator [Mixta tenebrionis]|uniref:Helix-turn-helix transcriptional regulator n=1 Tax=Mixta tenebrionis TaxID=2562439 RepID=A0A506VEU5_9GAMM|nr:MULTISPECIES: helix-turn-helix domain-containing protein [Mixta]QHM75801.1 putative HTH-type transcriptional regulator YybR [Mixta theicola]TPW44337.1 helix-turn-helix transcriptional regulator [Mixta tenebrionis]
MKKNSQPAAGLALVRGELLNPNCPSRELLKRITSRWTMLVMLALRENTLRFSEIRRAIGGISERMLAQTLRYMEEDGLLIRKAYEVVPPHVEYRLTPLGREASKHVLALTDWLESHFPLIEQQRSDRQNAG